MKLNILGDGHVSVKCPISAIEVDTEKSVSDTTINTGDISTRTVIYANGGKAVITIDNAKKKFTYSGDDVLTSFRSNEDTPETATVIIKSK